MRAARHRPGRRLPPPRLRGRRARLRASSASSATRCRTARGVTPGRHRRSRPRRCISASLGHERADRVLRAARRRPARARPDRRRVGRGRLGRAASSGQIARIKGCRAIGIAGGPDKCALARRRARLRRRDRLQGRRRPRRSCASTRPTASTSSSTTSAARCSTHVLAPPRPRRAGRHQRRDLAVQRDRGAARAGQLHAAARRAGVDDRLRDLRLRRPLRRGRRPARAVAAQRGAALARGRRPRATSTEFPDVLLRLFRGENTGKLVLALGEPRSPEAA